MDHDTGFAPNPDDDICTLSGCKKTTIEKWAQKGSWVIGIGGNNTGKPNKLIYAMEVEENLSYPEFRKKYPHKSKYLKQNNAGERVLVSTKFYYFGNNALNLPKGFPIIDRQGCKCVSNEDVCKLQEYIGGCGYDNYGVFGEPCNEKSSPQAKKC